MSFQLVNLELERTCLQMLQGCNCGPWCINTVLATVLSSVAAQHTIIPVPVKCFTIRNLAQADHSCLCLYVCCSRSLCSIQEVWIMPGLLLILCPVSAHDSNASQKDAQLVEVNFQVLVSLQRPCHPLLC